MVFVLLGVSLGAALLGAAAIYLLHNYGELFSYNGLSRNQVAKVKRELSKHYDLLSSVKGKTLFGNVYWRGIYIPKNGGNPLYYRYELLPNNGVSLHLYPMVYEMWSTNPNVLGDKTTAVYP